MTKLFQDAIDAARALSPDIQDEIRTRRYDHDRWGRARFPDVRERDRVVRGVTRAGGARRVCIGRQNEGDLVQRSLNLRFTAQAADELDAIIDYVRQRSPAGARQVRDRIRTMTIHLLAHPRSGVLFGTGIRKARVSPYPYLIFYEILADEHVVIGVRHAARDPSSMPGA